MSALARPPPRLPRTVRPVHYALRLEPDLRRWTFEGVVTADVQVLETTHEVVLNTLELEVLSASATQDGAAQRATAVRTESRPAERTTLQFARALTAGVAARIEVAFRGVLNDKLAGFYRSKYVVGGGEERYMATTQFEATDARRAFPCWDEPALKATFDVVLVVPEDRLAVSNMPVRATVALPERGLREVHFERTPVMSTYLLAMVVAEFDHVEATTAEGVQVRVYTPLGKQTQGVFALDVACRALSYYTRLFRIAYPLPKMDLLAIPDFAAGAMENWGCITYREAALLIDPVNSAAERRQRVARTVCHEIAHQWFGNLVTMEWWTHLWLNEGFARFLEFCAVDSLFPEWDIWSQFVLSIHGVALRHDALATSHPIEVPVHHPDEINEIFDVISYAKGASVIRMLSDCLGFDTFLAGLHLYLTRHAYKNAATTDLWDAMQEASGTDVRALMGPWTSAVGYPLVVVPALAEAAGAAPRPLEPLRQHRFLGAGSLADDCAWTVPVKALVGTPDGAVHLLDAGLFKTAQDGERVAALLRQHAASPAAWIKLNAGQVGFYRVLYPPEQFAALAAHIQQLPPSDRLGVVADAFALMRASHVPVGEMLSLLVRCKGDRDFSVWSEIATNMESLCRTFADHMLSPGLRRFLLDLFAEIGQTLVQQVEVEGSTDATLLQLYGIVHALLVLVGDAATQARAVKQFQAHCRCAKGTPQPGDKPVVPDLRLGVYTAAVQVGGDDVFQQVVDLYRRTELAEERRRCLQALGAAASPELQLRALEFALSSEVRPQDTVFALSAVATNLSGGRHVAWQFFVDRFADLDAQFNSGGQAFLLSGIVGAVVGVGVTQAEAARAVAFFAAHPWPAAERAINTSIESVRITAARVERDAVALGAWLAANAKL